jgi:hypothetical protein
MLTKSEETIFKTSIEEKTYTELGKEIIETIIEDLL